MPVDGTDLATVDIPRIVRIPGSTGIDVGRDSLSAVVEDYEPPFRFTGTISRITFRVASRPDRADVAATARTELAKE